jgi:hypothetical protein
MRTDQRWPEAEMRKCEVIVCRALSMLFCECDIRSLSRQTESFGDVPAGPEPASTDEGEKKNGKYLNRR